MVQLEKIGFQNLLSGTIAASLALAIVPSYGNESWPLCNRKQRTNCVVDGDTFWAQGIKYRISGLDAPEAGERARCKQERNLAAQSTRALQKMLNSGNVTLKPTGQDKYGRILVEVWTNKGQVTPMMIKAGLGKPFGPGAKWYRWCR